MCTKNDLNINIFESYYFPLVRHDSGETNNDLWSTQLSMPIKRISIPIGSLIQLRNWKLSRAAFH